MGHPINLKDLECLPLCQDHLEEAIANGMRKHVRLLESATESTHRYTGEECVTCMQESEDFQESGDDP